MNNSPIQFRRTPEIAAVLERLQAKTGLTNQSEVIRLAIMEMADRRGVLEGDGGTKKPVKKRRSP